MDGAWVTYAEAAARLGLSVEAVRQRAIRNRWARTLGNDKRARIRLPDEAYPTQTPVIRASDQALLDSLRDHVASLKAENETLKAQLAGAETRASEESAKTAQAIAAFESLAQRLEAMAAQRAIKPWWRRLLQRAG
jgi:hypothetical protein